MTIFIKKGKYLNGVPVVGGREHIDEAVKKYKINKIILAIPTASQQDKKKEILDICKYTGCQVQTVPGIYQLVNGEGQRFQLRDVEIEVCWDGILFV